MKKMFMIISLLALLLIVAGCGKSLAGKAIHLDDPCFQQFTEKVDESFAGTGVFSEETIFSGLDVMFESQECASTGEDILNCMDGPLAGQAYEGLYVDSDAFVADLLRHCESVEDPAMQLELLEAEYAEEFPDEFGDDGCIQEWLGSTCQSNAVYDRVVTCAGDEKEIMIEDCAESSAEFGIDLSCTDDEFSAWCDGEWPQEDFGYEVPGDDDVPGDDVPVVVAKNETVVKSNGSSLGAKSVLPAANTNATENKTESWKCVDEDGSDGYDAYVAKKSKTYLLSSDGTKKSTEEDSCDSTNMLRERICDASGQVTNAMFPCTGGTTCSDGACVSPSATVNATGNATGNNS